MLPAKARHYIKPIHLRATLDTKAQAGSRRLTLHQEENQGVMQVCARCVSRQLARILSRWLACFLPLSHSLELLSQLSELTRSVGHESGVRGSQERCFPYLATLGIVLALIPIERNTKTGEGEMYGRRQTKKQRKACEGTPYTIEPWDSRYYAVLERATGALVCVVVYLKGASEIIRRLSA